MTQYIGLITVILESDTPSRASETLCLFAKQLDDIGPEVIFADHNGDVEDYEKIERECEESQNFIPSVPTRFGGYEIHGVREFDDGQGKYREQVPDEEAQFWSLFGHIPGQGLACIGDFETHEHAEEIYARITGCRYA